MWYLWDWYEEIGPVPQGADFNLSVHAWAAVTDTRVTRREFNVLKQLYFTQLKRDNSETPPMAPATDAHIFATLSSLAKKPG